jgi:hypothetical protein
MNPILRALTATLVVILALGAGSSAPAYKIQLSQVHETMTRAAMDCLARSQGARPANCQLSRAALRSLRTHNDSAYKEAVRWPDNPLRETSIFSGPHALLNVIGGRCARLLDNSGDSIQQAGLPCRSHYGDLQFFHAMKSSVREPVNVTREKILAWAKFAYRVANGEVGPDQNFCGQFTTRSNFDASMVPPDFPYCGTEPSAWTVGEFFTFSCPTQPVNCNVHPTAARVRATATGAILHLIQDSYSQSHARRTDEPVKNSTNVAMPVMECGKPREYFHYNRLTSPTHGTADNWPELGGTCSGDREGDDAITASAVALYYLQQRKSADDFVAYLADRVF